MMGEWRDNPGYCPADAKGKRVVVHLRNGQIHGEKAASPAAPPGWTADGRGACNWGFSTGASAQFDIMHYRVIGG